MKTTILKGLAVVLLALFSGPGLARLEAPDHIIYGNASLFGAPAEPGTVIEMRSVPDDVLLARYELGRDPRLGAQFALHAPMDTVDPRLPGRSRSGDPVRIFIGSQLAAETTIGAAGRAVRLNIDPQTLEGGAAVGINDIAVLEPDGDSADATLSVTLNTTTDGPVEVAWETRDDTASGGGACGAGVDYLTDSGTLTVPAGSLTAALTVRVCDDSELEMEERFDVVLLSANPGVVSDATGVVTIQDNDGLPGIQVAEAWALLAEATNTEAMFQVSLSRSSDAPVSFDWRTEDGTAMAGVDYQAASGSLTIPAGETSASFSVNVLPAPATAQPNRDFYAVLSGPLNARLLDTRVRGVLVDPAFMPVVDHEGDHINGQNGLTGLSDPSALVLSPDGLHVYVASLGGDSVAVLNRDMGSGALSFNSLVDASGAGFGSLRLDGPRHMAIAPDGAYLYVAAGNDNSIAVFARDAASGALSFVENNTDGDPDPDSGFTLQGLQGVARLAMSADGGHLYASASAGGGNGAVAVFARDVASGALTFLEAEVNGMDDPDDPGAGVVALSRPAGLTVSADGQRLYVASRFGDALLVFDREADPASAAHGELSFATALRDGIDGVSGLGGAADVAVSADGAHVYVVAEQDNAVVRFQRDDGTGELLWQRAWRKGDPDLPGLGGPQYVELSPDGATLFVTGFADDSLTVFERLAESGADGEPGDLRMRRTVLNGQGEVQFMAEPLEMAASLDNLHLYVIARLDNNVLLFRRIGVAGAGVIFSDGFE